MSSSTLQTNNPPATQALAQPLSKGGDGELRPCWNQIGVYGNGTCPELPKFVHCRNCPVYSNAGVQLLDRALPAEYRKEWAAHFAQEKSLAAPAKTSAVLFRIRVEWLALPTQAFQEVAERRLIHSLPHRRQGIVLGLVNVRGELLICVSLGRLLALENLAPRQSQRTVYDRLLVVNGEGNRFAFPVDEVQGIHRFEPRHLKAPPATVALANSSITQGVFVWQERTVGLLDAVQLFSSLNRSLS